MRRFVIGDIHGRYKALVQVLKLCNFNYEDDKLIVLGDIVDGGIDTYKVVEELLKIKNLVFIMGNHDEFFLNHLSSGWSEEVWLSQGGVNTVLSYHGIVETEKTMFNDSHIITREVNVPVTHQEFFNTAKYYHTEDMMLFVHGGIIPGIPLYKQQKDVLLWDRELILIAQEHTIPPFEKIFVGHTTTQTYDSDVPIRYHNLYMLDCGAGWSGRLAIMDIDSDKYWLSDKQTPARK